MQVILLTQSSRSQLPCSIYQKDQVRLPGRSALRSRLSQYLGPRIPRACKLELYVSVALTVSGFDSAYVQANF